MSQNIVSSQPRDDKPMDTKAEVVAQHAERVRSQLKKPKWNVPNKIQLCSSKELIIGRVTNKGPDIMGLMLHSSKLPSMLSRKHASLKYNSTSEQWRVEDLQSLNGIYVNHKKIDPSVPTPLEKGDVVCFGVNIPRNVFKFTFEGDVLKKVACLDEDAQTGNKSSCVKTHDQSQSGVETQDQSRSKSGGVKTHDQSQGQPSGVKTQDQSQGQPSGVKVQDQSQSGSSSAKRKHSSDHSVTSSKRSKLSDPTTTATKATHDRGTASHTTTASPILSGPPSLKPSPALSIKSTQEVDIDELFEGPHKDTTEEVLTEAIFGVSDSKVITSPVMKSTEGLDATTIQIQMAKTEMEVEKHKLMSSIEALKSQLAAKDQLLAKKEEKEKIEKENENVMSSMQEEFTCVICQELFINAYTLPCAHSFCEWCIKEWMKTKKQKDCPICRKKITSDPVHSLVLDNAIQKMVSKMSPKEQEDRKEEERRHKQALEGLAPPKPATKKATTAASRSATASRIAEALSGPGHRVTISFNSSSRDNPIVIGEDDSESEDSDEEEDSSESESSSGTSVEGYRDAYYGGYGRCFNCGRRGHWAPGCPY